MPAQRCDLLRLGPSVATRQTGDVVQCSAGQWRGDSVRTSGEWVIRRAGLLTATNTCAALSPPSCHSAARAPACSTSRPSVTLELCACVRLGKWPAASQSAKIHPPMDLIGGAQVHILVGDANARIIGENLFDIPRTAMQMRPLCPSADKYWTAIACWCCRIGSALV